jgi:hypothetical protein
VCITRSQRHVVRPVLGSWLSYHDPTKFRKPPNVGCHCIQYMQASSPSLSQTSEKSRIKSSTLFLSSISFIFSPSGDVLVPLPHKRWKNPICLRLSAVSKIRGQNLWKIFIIVFWDKFYSELISSQIEHFGYNNSRFSAIDEKKKLIIKNKLSYQFICKGRDGTVFFKLTVSSQLTNYIITRSYSAQGVHFRVFLNKGIVGAIRQEAYTPCAALFIA